MTFRDQVFDKLANAGVGVGVAPELADGIAKMHAEAVRPWRDIVDGLLNNPREHDYETCVEGESVNADRGCQRCIARALLDKVGA